MLGVSCSKLEFGLETLSTTIPAILCHLGQRNSWNWTSWGNTGLCPWMWGDVPTFGDMAMVLLLVQLQDGGAEAAMCLPQLAGCIRLPGGLQAGKEDLVLSV